MKVNYYSRFIFKTLTVIALFVIFSSHDLYIKTENYFPEPYSDYSLFMVNGTFYKSENVIASNRIINSKVIGPDFLFIPSDSNWFYNDDITYLRFKTEQKGSYVAGVSTLPSILELISFEFDYYLEHDGVLDILEKRRKNQTFTDTVREKYSKHVKTIFQVSNKKTDHYKKIFGYPVEFIPLQNPYETVLNDSLKFILLHNNQPLENQLIYVGCSNHTVGEDEQEEIKIRTNKEGKFKIGINKKGIWYLRTIYMVESKEDGINYESNWATITFEIR